MECLQVVQGSSRKILLSSIILPVLVCFTGCSTTRQPLAYRSFAGAYNLHGYCETNHIQSSEVLSADSLLREAEQSIKNELMELAYWQSDMAAILYKLSIARDELQKSNKRVTKLKLAVNKASRVIQGRP